MGTAVTFVARSRALIVASLFAIALPSWAALPYECGKLQNPYGPYDYTNPIHKRDKLEIVEIHHFQRFVEALQIDHRGRPPGGGIDYTLRAFPNHHRALFALAQLQSLHTGVGLPHGLKWPTYCYYERAIAFAPEDANAHLLYGIYLTKNGGSFEEARGHYERAVAMQPDSAETHYNYGLALADANQYDAALEHAQRAYEIGYPLMGLRDKLVRAGVWREQRVEE
ncbi:MAG: tetratricopeptide repeat protein [Pseudomonadota bacterium]